MILLDKVAVVYGGGGDIGGAVARAFAAEGATVFVTGRAKQPVDAVVRDIVAAGGAAEAAEVDALDEGAVDAHLHSVVESAGGVDISFNAVGVRPVEILGVPLTEIDAARFVLPIATHATSYFVTARLAARHMIPRKSGVIMTVTAFPARAGTPLNGGYGPAQAAKEQLTRDLSYELAPQGIRVVGLRPHGIAETRTMEELYEIKAKQAMTREQFNGVLAGMTHPRRSSALDEVASMAVYMASDRASGMTGTTVNLTMGGLDD
jgi:NAD(P)-dependent dehydrogenase (short-subunit alcohol dehydrogenase family)